jgi:hypothetical protein
MTEHEIIKRIWDLLGEFQPVEVIERSGVLYLQTRQGDILEPRTISIVVMFAAIDWLGGGGRYIACRTKYLGSPVYCVVDDGEDPAVALDGGREQHPTYARAILGALESWHP